MIDGGISTQPNQRAQRAPNLHPSSIINNQSPDMELSKIQEKSRFDKICDFEWCYTVTLTRIMYMMLFVDTSSLNIEYEQLNRKYSKG